MLYRRDYTVKVYLELVEVLRNKADWLNAQTDEGKSSRDLIYDKVVTAALSCATVHVLPMIGSCIADAL